MHHIVKPLYANALIFDIEVFILFGKMETGDGALHTHGVLTLQSAKVIIEPHQII